MAAKFLYLKNLWTWLDFSGDEKMSKSKGNILDPLEIIETYGLIH